MLEISGRIVYTGSIEKARKNPMERRTLKKKLYLSGIDGRAAQLARENGLGCEIADFCYAPVLEDPARRGCARRRRT